MKPVTLVKLGGSLITEKERPDTARREVITRLAAELADAWPRAAGGIVVGHGSGSFGHVAAWRRGLLGHAAALEPSAAGDVAGAASEPPAAAQDASARDVAAASEVQAKAAELHRIVLAALREAGLPAYSIAPGSAAVAADARVVSFHGEPFALGLSRSLLPVTYGDVVLDRERGASILSTETVLAELARWLLERGWPVERAIWLGGTEGVYDEAGETVPSVPVGTVGGDRGSLGAVGGSLGAVGGSGATDVTGGMAHRLETALSLARLGIRSWIGDGNRAGALAGALAGEEIGGTTVPAAP